MENETSVPEISRITCFWGVVLSILTAGLYPVVLALYLSIWVYRKRRRGLAVFLVCLGTLMTLLEALPPRLIPHTLFANWFGDLDPIIWIAAAFLLRYEFQRYHAERDGYTLEMNPLLTALFSVFYINYRLWTIADFAESSRPTQLSL